MLDNLYRQVLIDHFQHRRNFNELTGADVRHIHYKNPTCGDVMTLYLELDGDHVKRVSFLGEGCIISMASASMMTELIANKSLADVSVLREAFEQLIKTGHVDDSIDFGDALSLQGVHQLRARHNCALMTWQALDRVLEQTNLRQP
ncbi:SUF system FeS assembly protein, NifU family [Exiguobacterium sp. S17]|nr:SUF system FeS assembly protein, NifU family [Exiguobacterium sp. S17]